MLLSRGRSKFASPRMQGDCGGVSPRPSLSFSTSAQSSPSQSGLQKPCSQQREVVHRPKFSPRGARKRNKFAGRIRRWLRRVHAIQHRDRSTRPESTAAQMVTVLSLARLHDCRVSGSRSQVRVTKYSRSLLSGGDLRSRLSDCHICLSNFGRTERADLVS